MSDLRPVGARALKSAIDSLRPVLYDAIVLDLFAGQGRFGLAALNEGAKQVTFVEKDRPTAQELREETKRWADKAEIFTGDAFTFLQKTATKFDVLFADPPFRFWNAEFEKKLFSAVNTVLSPGSIFLVKYPKRVVPSGPSTPFTVGKTTPFGESKLVYFHYGESSKA